MTPEVHCKTSQMHLFMQKKITILYYNNMSSEHLKPCVKSCSHFAAAMERCTHGCVSKGALITFPEVLSNPLSPESAAGTAFQQVLNYFLFLSYKTYFNSRSRST